MSPKLSIPTIRFWSLITGSRCTCFCSIIRSAWGYGSEAPDSVPAAGVGRVLLCGPCMNARGLLEGEVMDGAQCSIMYSLATEPSPQRPGVLNFSHSGCRWTCWWRRDTSSALHSSVPAESSAADPAAMPYRKAFSMP